MKASRSFLFVPGDNERKLAKAWGAGADALILDLEDSVAPSAKATARQGVLSELLSNRRARGPQLFVRVNSFGSDLLLQDLVTIVRGAPDGIVLPKLSGGAQIEVLAGYLSALEAREGLVEGSIKVIGICTETPGGVLTLASGGIRPHPRLLGLMWGAEDLSVEVGATDSRDADGAYAEPFRLARSLCLFAAASVGAIPIDAVFTVIANLAALEAECAAARLAGFVGKAAIHPDQVEIINRGFTPTHEEHTWARRVIAAFGKDWSAGVVALDGKMIDAPHLRRARQILDRDR